MTYIDYCIISTNTVRDAMRLLDKTEKQIVFVLSGNRLVGTLTDGDIRRYLLRGGQMGAPVSDAAHTNPKTATSRKQAKKILLNTGLPAVPVVSTDGTLLNIVFKQDTAASIIPQLGVPVVIMAGGRGTRLDPYTRILPKPLLPVGDRPILEHIMQRFESYGCTEFHVIVNYKKQLLKSYFSESERQYYIHWYDEETPLGTGGGLSLLRGRLQETFFFTNCDILLCTDYAKILGFHQKNKNDITMVGAYKNIVIPYGVVEIGENGVIEGAQEKPEFSFLTNTGLYLVEPEVLEDVKDAVPMDFPDIIERRRRTGHKTAVYPVSEHEWLDMGQPDELERMRERLYGEE